MTSIADARSQAVGPAESGFVLMGVVVFVLALTILGLSLFSLSSYEAQFLGRSLDQTKAFYSASGGLERAKYVLGATGRLEQVGQNLPMEGVITAVAIQDQGGVPKTNGPIQWGGSDVLIQVTAQESDRIRALSGTFHPEPNVDYYKRIVTVTDQLLINDSDADDANVCGMVHLNGGLWIASGDSTTVHSCASYQDPIRVDALPTPDVATFIGSHLPLAATAPYPPGNGNPVYVLNAGSASVGYFKTPDQGTDLGLHDGRGSPMLKIGGRVVWMFPSGVRFDSHVSVEATTPDACLVIMAQHGSSGDDPNAAIWFFSSLVNVNHIPIILVSDARVLIENTFNQGNPNGMLDHISIFAQDVKLTGPKPPFYMTLSHPLGDPADAMIDTLFSHQALPNVTTIGAVGDLTLIPGSWRESGN